MRNFTILVLFVCLLFPVTGMSKGHPNLGLEHAFLKIAKVRAVVLRHRPIHPLLRALILKLKKYGYTRVQIESVLSDLRINANDPKIAKFLDALFKTADTDRDGLNDDLERLNNCDPSNPDTDGDGLKDGDEINIHKTLCNNANSDALSGFNDGRNDGQEVASGTDPLSPFSPSIDTDKDGLSDADEVLGTNGCATDPNDPDTDHDFLPDGQEFAYGTMAAPGCPSQVGGGYSQDSDNDGLQDGDEVNFQKTNPLSPDTDSDAWSDLYETQISKTNPRLCDNETDSDRDGLGFCSEVAAGTNPSYYDTDGDGHSDGSEVWNGSDPNDPNSTPQENI